MGINSVKTHEIIEQVFSINYLQKNVPITM